MRALAQMQNKQNPGGDGLAHAGPATAPGAASA
jgi:hypothetical protein